MKYKIYKKQYHNEHGEIENKMFFIRKRKRCLGITYWRTVTHTECGYCDCNKVATTFKTEELAEEFVKKVLCPEIPREKWVEIPIKEISCE